MDVVGGVTAQLDAHMVDTNFQAERDPISNTLTFNKINSSLIFQHIKNISLNDYTGIIQ